MSEEYDEISLDLIRKAKARALKILEYADRTERQLRDKLKEGDFPPFAVDEAVAYVQGLHYQDDRRFAESYIRSRRDQKSRYEISNELRLKGIDSALADEVLDEAELMGEDTVCRLFLKKYGTKDLTDPSIYQKAFRYFAGKGFSYEEIKEGITNGIEKSQDEETDT